METQKSFRHLEQLALSAGFSKSDGMRALTGLERLEVYASQFVAAWVQGLNKTELCSLFTTDLFANVIGATNFINLNLPKGLDAGFVSIWVPYNNLIQKIEENGANRKNIEMLITALFTSAIALRMLFEAKFERQSYKNIQMTVETSRVSDKLFEYFKLKVSELPLEVSFVWTLQAQLSQLPVLLNLLSQNGA